MKPIRLVAFALCAGVLGLASGRTEAQRADDAPILCIESGGHNGAVRHVALTADATRLVSVGDDKVVRIWDLRAQRQQQTLRYQIQLGPFQTLFAADVSSDSAHPLIAVGEQEDAGKSADVLIFDPSRAPGQQQIHRLPTYSLNPRRPGYVSDVHFSSDGKRLVTAAGEVQVWDVSSGKLLWEQIEKGGNFFGSPLSPAESAAFSPDNMRVAAAFFNGTVRVWSSDGKKLRDTHVKTSRLRSLAWSHDGKLAFGGDDGVLYVWEPNAAGSEPISFPARGDSITCVAFSANGRHVLAGGGEGGRNTAVQIFDVASGRAAGQFTQHATTVLALATVKDGTTVVSGDADGQIHVWDEPTQKGVLSFRGVGETARALAWSPNSGSIAWRVRENGDWEHAFDLDSAAPYGLLKPADAWQGSPGDSKGRRLNLTRDKDNNTLLRITEGAGKVLAQIKPQYDWDEFRAAEWLDDTHFLIGSDLYLAVYEVGKSRPVRLLEGHQGGVKAAAVSPNRRYLATAGTDQTIRIWDLQDTKATVIPVLSIFWSADDEWIAWTPQGYYNASPLGDRYIGWQVNRGPARDAEFYEAAKYAPLFYRPDVLYYLFKAGGIAAALKQADDVRGQQSVAYDINHDLMKLTPPAVAIQSPAEESVVEQPEVTITARLEGAAQEGTSLRAVIAEAPSARKLELVEGPNGGEQKIPVRLLPGRNTIRVYAVNKQGVRGLVSERHVTYKTADVGYDSVHILSIGIGKFPGLDAQWQLTYPTEDAKAIDALYRAQENKLFRHVDAQSLVDGQATGENIRRALEALCRRVDGARRDFVVLFVSTHGFPGGADKTSLFFAPSDIDISSTARMGETGIGWNNIINELKQLPCPVLLLIDTCHSGGVGIDLFRNLDPVKDRGFDPRKEVIREATENGLHVMSACRPTESSWEHSDWMHGAFTKAFLELVQQSNTMRVEPDGTIIFHNAFDYVYTRVRELTGKLAPPVKQSPKVYEPLDSAGDLPIAKVR